VQSLLYEVKKENVEEKMNENEDEEEEKEAESL